MPRSTKGPIDSHQTKVRKLFAKVTGTGTAALNFGGNELALTDQGTGDYLLTLKTKGKRILGVNVSMVTDSTRFEVGTVTEGVSVQIQTFGYNNTTATDAVFYAEITVCDSSKDL